MISLVFNARVPDFAIKIAWNIKFQPVTCYKDQPVYINLFTEMCFSKRETIPSWPYYTRNGLRVLMSSMSDFFIRYDLLYGSSYSRFIRAYSVVIFSSVAVSPLCKSTPVKQTTYRLPSFKLNITFLRQKSDFDF